MDSNKVKDFLKKEVKTLNNFGGVGKYTLPKSHKPYKKIPIVGTNCSNCNYYDDKENKCTEEHYIKWNGDGKLKDNPDLYVSDWWEAKQVKTNK